MIPMQGKWHVLLEKDLATLATSDPQNYAALDSLIADYQLNPLKYFLPHGRQRKDKWGNDGVAVLSDCEHDLILVRALNQSGKSAIGAIRTMLELMPTEEDWPIFTQHGVEWRPWQGPRTAIVASYEWGNTYDIWETAYQKFAPRKELGPHALAYGKYYDADERIGEAFAHERGKAKTFPQGFKTGVQVLHMACGSRLIFLCYHQNLSAWTGKQADVVHLDEQCPEDLFDEVSQRQITRGIYTPIINTMTPHCVQGRPDTGAANWIKTKLIDQGATKGRKFAEYIIRAQDVPNEIMSAEKKAQLYQHWIEEPERLHDEKKMREGRARYYAEWEVGGGTVISAFNADIHMIEPFAFEKFKPTYYRMIDHGENPCAALLIALMPWGDAVCFSEYYEFSNGISKNATGIVETLCGNSRRKIDDVELEGQTWPIYEEVQDHIEFYASEMDPRSFGSRLKESNRTIGVAYNQYGCYVTPASGIKGETKDNAGVIPLLCDWFELDRNHPHIHKRLNRAVPELAKEYGSPRIYMFNTLRNFRAEIEGWIRNPRTGKPLDKNDHLVSCAKFFTARERPYMGDWNENDRMEGKKATRTRTEFTNY